MSPLGRLEVTCLGLDTSGILTVDRVATGSFRVRIRGRSDLDLDLNPNPLSDFDGMDSAESSSKSFSFIEGATSFTFR